MRTLKHFRFATFLALILLLSFCKSSQKSAQEENWIQLFNGKDLNDWVIKMSHHPLGENYNNTFRVRDGMLVVSYDDYDEFNGEFGHIYYKDPFSYYKLRVEYRAVGEQVKGGAGWAVRNNGVMFHCQAPETVGLDQDFPVSIEAQLLGGLGEGERPTGNVCTPSTHIVMDGELVTRHCTNSSSATFHGDQWVTFDLVVLGSDIVHHIVNGDTVLTYSKPQIGGAPDDYPIPEGTLLNSGYISLQAESGPFEFRKVELLDLSAQYE